MKKLYLLFYGILLLVFLCTCSDESSRRGTHDKGLSVVSGQRVAGLQVFRPNAFMELNPTPTGSELGSRCFPIQAFSVTMALANTLAQ